MNRNHKWSIGTVGADFSKHGELFQPMLPPPQPSQSSYPQYPSQPNRSFYTPPPTPINKPKSKRFQKD